MGNFAEQTAVTGSDGRYTAVLSEDWEIWGPNGGYVAAVALRAAGAESRFGRPATCSVHFLSVAKFEEVQLDVVILKATRRAESIRVEMRQGDKLILVLSCWAVQEDLPGLEHSYGEFEWPKPDAVVSIEDHLARLGEERTPPFKFWWNLDEKPLEWFDDWERRPVTSPVWRSWLRFTPQAMFPGDTWMDACRILLLADLGSWPAANRAHRSGDWIAPSLDVNVQFTALRPESEWIFVDHVSPVAADGLVGAHSRLYAEDGTLLSTAVTQLLATSTNR